MKFESPHLRSLIIAKLFFFSLVRLFVRSFCFERLITTKYTTKFFRDMRRRTNEREKERERIWTRLEREEVVEEEEEGLFEPPRQQFWDNGSAYFFFCVSF